MKINISIFLSLLFFFQISFAEKRGPNGAVASVEPLASRAGIEILQKGGNAVDAAVAVAFTLAVVHPQAGNIGGGGFLLFRNSDGNIFALDFREKAPLNIGCH